MTYILYFLSILSLAQSAVITKWSPLSVSQLGFWRLLVASVILRLIFSPKGLFKKPQKLLYVFVCGVSLYLHFYSYFYAAKNTSVAHTLLLFSLNPLFTGLISRYALREHFSKFLLFSFACGFAAVSCLVYPLLVLQQSLNLADLSALLSGLTYSIYIVSAKLAQKNTTEDSFNVISWSFMIASLCFLINLLLRQDEIWITSGDGWLSLVLLILFPTLLGHAVFLYLTKTVNINWMSVGKLIEPPVATLLAYIVLGQTPESSFYAAFFFLIASGLFLFKDKMNSSNHQKS